MAKKLDKVIVQASFKAGKKVKKRHHPIESKELKKHRGKCDTA